MSLKKSYDGYSSFSYLEQGADYKAFDLADELARVPQFRLPLSDEDEARCASLIERCLFVSMHEHLGVFPERIEETPEYVRHGRMATAFEGLAASHWDAVFDNLMDGICTIHSRSGWQWDDVLHDLGMRLCDPRPSRLSDPLPPHRGHPASPRRGTGRLDRIDGRRRDDRERSRSDRHSSRLRAPIARDHLFGVERARERAQGRPRRRPDQVRPLRRSSG